ncbi:MAG: hypothetical protein IBJ18_00405 [Phycisphaerales bacterium]|nr:hypothetical protein [Phycisphaerales bacterium]
MSQIDSAQLYVRPRPLLSMPLAVVIATVVVCLTVLGIYLHIRSSERELVLYQRARELDALRRASHMAWLSRVDEVNATMKTALSQLKNYADSFPRRPPISTEAAEEAYQDALLKYRVNEDYMKSVIAEINEMNLLLKKGQPKAPE